MSSAYKKAWRDSIERPQAFWLDAARAGSWERAPGRAWSDGEGWFPQGTINTCFNCIDRHVAAGRGDSSALIYDSPVTGTVRSFSYAELLQEIGRVAKMLARLGVGKGDRVVIYMPMVPETLFAMLACA